MENPSLKKKKKNYNNDAPLPSWLFLLDQKTHWLPFVLPWLLQVKTIKCQV